MQANVLDGNDSGMMESEEWLADGAEEEWASNLGDPQPTTAQPDDDEGLVTRESEESVFAVMAHHYDFRTTTAAQRPRKFGAPSNKKLRRRLV